MFRHTKLRSIGNDGDFEVLTKEGKLVGAIIRKSGTEKEWEKSGGGLPYEVYRNGKLIAVESTLPSAQKILDRLVSPK
jgi:hypothetical protein